MRKTIITIICLLGITCIGKAQEWAIATNILDYANFATVNGQVSVAVAQKFSLQAEARYNNWPSIELIGRDMRINKQAYSFGMRYWPWHVYSGWWFQCKGQYMEYSSGGIMSRTLHEGDAYGGGLSLGYTYMLTSVFNIEFGVGAWGGYRTGKKYQATTMGKYLGDVEGIFVAPDDVRLSILLSFGGKKRYRYSRYYIKTQKKLEKDKAKKGTLPKVRGNFRCSP